MKNTVETKQKMQELATTLSESDKPITTASLCAKLDISADELMDYAEELPTYLDPASELVVTTANNETAYLVVNREDKYSSDKTEGGYSDPTAAAAMRNYKSSTKDWKYQVGDIWYSESKKGYLDPFLIVATYPEKATLVRVYEDGELESSRVDLSSGMMVHDLGFNRAFDCSYICTKPYAWLVKKDAGNVGDWLMDEVRRKLAAALRISSDDAGNAYMDIVDEQRATIEDLTERNEAQRKMISELRAQTHADSDKEAVDRMAALIGTKNPREQAKQILFGDYGFSAHKDELEEWEKELHLSEPVQICVLQTQVNMLEAERDRLYNLLCGVCDYEV